MRRVFIRSVRAVWTVCHGKAEGKPRQKPGSAWLTTRPRNWALVEEEVGPWRGGGSKRTAALLKGPWRVSLM